MATQEISTNKKSRGRPKINKEIIYASQRNELVNKILNELNITENNKQFIMNDITTNQINNIIALVPYVKRYYDTNKWHLNQKDNNKSIVMTIFRYTLKENNINYICKSVTKNVDNKLVSKQLYIVY